ncbi:MAG: response regulator [Cyanobium sp.]|nr:response regulator [Cyanobium sp.]
MVVRELKAAIPVIGGSAYRGVRLKLQGALQALAVESLPRTLAVADFSTLYRCLPEGSRIDLTLALDGNRLRLSLEVDVSAATGALAEQRLQHLAIEHTAGQEETGGQRLHCHRQYWMGAGCRTAVAEACLQDSTAEELNLRATETEEANNAKREFLSRMSHELRTPMNAIIGMTHLALRTDLDARQRDYLEKIGSAGKNLLGIINDILDFSKIEAGKINLERINFRLDQVLGDVTNLVADRIFSKGVELLFSVDEQVPDQLNGDPLRLTQVLVNLLSNAAKFTEEGQITMRVSQLQRSGGEVELLFAVQDTGIGMDKEQIGRLFQAFSQADVSTTRRYGGTGLGLSICQRLLELMGGEISVTSRPGEGSCFRARARFGLAGSRSRRIVPAALTAMRVLVVDDNSVAREVILGLLEHLPLRCEAVATGEEALDRVREASGQGDPYGLLLLDWQLGSGIDGLEVARRLRSEATLPQPRTVLVTAYGREEAFQQAGDDTIDACLTKPIRPSALIDSLTGLFAEGPDQRIAGTHGAEPGESGEEGWNLRDLRVLLVEDNPINQQIASELLEIVGVRVAVANNGVEALAWLETHAGGELPCDVVLLDLNMPEMDGWECARRIRSQAHWQSLPVLAMTAHAMQQERDRCLAIGMQDHITKPINPDHLYERLRHWGSRAGGGAEAPLSRTARTDAALLELEGFDTGGALRRVAGNAGLYRRLLRSFHQTQADALERLERELARNALAEAEHIVHTVKGVAANLGATALADAAACLDDDLKAGRCSEPLKQRFGAQLALTFSQLSAFFSVDPDPIDAGDGPGDEEGDGAMDPGGADPGQLAEQRRLLLETLDGYLASGDGEALELVASRRRELITHLGRDGHAQLAARLERFDFSAARQLLAQGGLPGSP